MAKVDLSSSEWCDLIFSGKNKAYGAYQLREKSPKRHNIAVILVIVIALIGFSIPTLIKMATPKQKEVMTEVTTLSQLEEPEIKQEEMKRVEPVAPPPPALKSSIKFTAPVIKKDEEVRDEDEIKSQQELTETKVAISIADVKGNDEEHGKDIADLKQVVTQAEPRTFAFSGKRRSFRYKIIFKTIHKHYIGRLIKQFLALVICDFTHSRKTVYIVRSLFFNGVFGLHIELFRHLIAIISEEIIVKRLIVTCNGTSDGRGMRGKYRSDFRNSSLQVEGSHTGHPLMCLINHFICLRQVVAIKTLYYLSGSIRKHGCFIIITVCMQ